MLSRRALVAGLPAGGAVAGAATTIGRRAQARRTSAAAASARAGAPWAPGLDTDEFEAPSAMAPWELLTPLTAAAHALARIESAPRVAHVGLLAHAERVERCGASAQLR